MDALHDSQLTNALRSDWTLRDVQRLYLRLKDQLFEGWARPYNTERLESFIKQELGPETTMAECGDLNELSDRTK